MEARRVFQLAMDANGKSRTRCSTTCSKTFSMSTSGEENEEDSLESNDVSWFLGKDSENACASRQKRLIVKSTHSNHNPDRVWEGDQYVPRVGKEVIEQFEKSGALAEIIGEASANLMHFWNATLPDIESTLQNMADGLACAVIDPTEEDCPLVYVSRSFEQLIGYSREFALGRNLRFLQPNSHAEDELANGEELRRMQVFFGSKADMTRSSMFSLMLNEREDGAQSWQLLRMECVRVEPQQRPYVILVQRKLNMTIEDAAADDYSMVKHMRQRLLKHEHDQTQPLLDWHGDNFCPQDGMEAVQEFQQHRSCRNIFAKLFTKLQNDYCISAETLARTADDLESSLSCCLVDVEHSDHPVVYVSHGFEILTGYAAEFALGRNMRFLQPRKHIQKQLANRKENDRIEEFLNACDQCTTMASLSLSEHSNGEPFWNLMQMEKVVVDGHVFVLILHHNVLLPLEALLFGEGSSSLEALQASLHTPIRQSAQELSFGLESRFIDWLHEANTPIAEPLPFCMAKVCEIPQLGVELKPQGKSDWHLLSLQMLSCIHDGIRHFCLHDVPNCFESLHPGFEILSKMCSERTNPPALFFSVCINATQIHETLLCLDQLELFSQVEGPHALLLDVHNACKDTVAEAWQTFSVAFEASHMSEKCHLGLWGGNPKLLTALCTPSSISPSIFALEVNPAAIEWRVIASSLRLCEEFDVQPLAYGCFGNGNGVLLNECVQMVSAEHQLDPELFVAAWLADIGIASVAAHWDSCQRARHQVQDFLSLCEYAVRPQSSQILSLTEKSGFKKSDFTVLQNLPKMNSRKLRLSNHRHTMIQRTVRAVLGKLPTPLRALEACADVTSDGPMSALSQLRRSRASTSKIRYSTFCRNFYTSPLPLSEGRDEFDEDNPQAAKEEAFIPRPPAEKPNQNRPSRKLPSTVEQQVNRIVASNVDLVNGRKSLKLSVPGKTPLTVKSAPASRQHSPGVSRCSSPFQSPRPSSACDEPLPLPILPKAFRSHRLGIAASFKPPPTPPPVRRTLVKPKPAWSSSENATVAS